MADPLTVTRRIIANTEYLIRMFGKPTLVGLSLLEATFANQPWLTVQEIAQATRTSEDTVRRRLTEMVGAGRAWTKRCEHRRVYRLSPKMARDCIAFLNRNEPVKISLQCLSQNAAATCGCELP